MILEMDDCALRTRHQQPRVEYVTSFHLSIMPATEVLRGFRSGPLADRNPATSELRLRGIDVTTTPDVGLLGAMDPVQLAHAHSQDRLLFTHDADFVALHLSDPCPGSDLKVVLLSKENSHGPEAEAAPLPDLQETPHLDRW